MSQPAPQGAHGPLFGLFVAGLLFIALVYAALSYVMAGLAATNGSNSLLWLLAIVLVIGNLVGIVGSLVLAWEGKRRQAYRFVCCAAPVTWLLLTIAEMLVSLAF